MNVANKSIIRKLTARTLSSDKRRNFFIVAAIVLTAFMITSVFSVGMSYYNTMMLSPFWLEGNRCHAAMNDPSQEQLDTMRSLGYIRRIGFMYRSGKGYLKGFEDGISIAAVTQESWRYFQAPVFTGIVGDLPKAENEIALSRAHFERIGINEPTIGMEIPMEFEVGDFNTNQYGEKQSETFILSAIYTEYVSLMPNANTPAFVSEAFAKKHGTLGNMNVNFLFPNQNRAIEFTKRLARDLNIEYEREVAVHPGLERQPESGSSTMYIAIAIIVVFFMFVGFLLIYNVMYISVSKDVRFYGLLKTMGTTPKQLRRIVNGQVLTMYLIGLPIGLAAAALASFAIVPAFAGSSRGTAVSFSPLIFIGGAVFALLTAYIGASVSARIAAKVSPIEAVRYADAQNVHFKPRSSANGKSFRMAWRNTFRDRKRAFIVLLSLFLGITVFTAAMSIANSMDITGNTDYWYDHDIEIFTADTRDNEFGVMGMDKGFIKEIANLPGVSEVREQTLGFAVFKYPPEAAAAVESTGGFFSPLLEIAGVDRAYMEELNEKRQVQIDIEAFERGEIVLVYGYLGVLRMGDIFYELFPIGTELYFEAGQQTVIPINTKIAGYLDYRNMTGFSLSFASGGLYLIMSNSFLESIGAKAGVSNIGVNIVEGLDERVNADISAIVKEAGMVMSSAYESRREQEAARLTMFVMGSTISGILALIGIFNFINLISVGLLTRRREFATIESVGMTKKQMRLMLRWEGAVYWILTIAAGVTAGTGIAYGLFWLVRNQDPIVLPKFLYPALPVAIVFCLIILICTITPEICYRGISKMTLVERLREVE